MDIRKDANPNHVRFAEKAGPHSWYLVMESLDQQARALYGDAGDHSLVIQQDASGEAVFAFDSTHKSIFLLAGFALENAIKAFLIYENPNWICNGAINKRLRSHKLVDLHLQSKLVPYKNRKNSTLRAFEDGLESWARYPCSLTYDDTRDEALLPLQLWLDYRFLLTSYERKLRRILALNWKGPHGTGGKFAMTGETFPPVPSYNHVYSSWPPHRRRLEDYLVRLRGKSTTR